MSKKKVNEGIKRVISELMDSVMNRVLITDPFIKDKHYSNNPLYAALVPEEIFKYSHLARGLVTPFGGIWEKLAIIVAQEYHGHCEKDKIIIGEVGEESLRRIHEVLNKIGYYRVPPNWDVELKYILEGKGMLFPVRVRCGLYIDSKKTKKKYTFEVQAPLINRDTTGDSKEKMFQLLAMNTKRVDSAFYALPYNPYGKHEDYNWDFPMRWFDRHNDELVLIGKEFWELIGGKGTYNQIISEINSLGKEYRERIYRDFLGIEPLEGANELLL